MSENLGDDYIAQIAMLLEATERQSAIIEQQQKHSAALASELKSTMGAWSEQQLKTFKALSERQSSSLNQAAAQLSSVADAISPQIRRAIDSSATSAATTLVNAVKLEVERKIEPYVAKINAAQTDAVAATSQLDTSLKQFKPKVFWILAAACGAVFLVFCLAVFGLLSWETKQVEALRVEKSDLQSDMANIRLKDAVISYQGRKIKLSTCGNESIGYRICISAHTDPRYGDGSNGLQFVVPEGF